MTKIVYCGEYTNKSLYILGVTIGYCILGLSKTYVSEKCKKPFKNHPIFYVYCMFFAESLMLIIYFIQQKFYSSKVNYKRVKKYSKIKVCLYIVALSLADLFSTFCGNLFMVKGVKQFDNIYKVVYFITTCILMKTVMKHSYYRHHWIGICTKLGNVFILTLVNIFQTNGKPEKNDNNINDDETSNIVLYLIFSSCEEILSGFQDVYEKYLMDIQYINPILLVGLEGIIGFTMLSIVFLPCPHLYNFPCPYNLEICKGESLENFPEKINDIFTKKGYLLSHIFLICGLLSFNLFRSLTIFYYSPIHKAMANTGKLVLYWILGMMDIDYFNGIAGFFHWENIFSFFAYFISVIGIFIFLEFLIIGLFNLDRNTSLHITKRCILEENEIQFQSLFKDDESIDNSEDDKDITH